MILEISTRIGCSVNCKHCPQSLLCGKYKGVKEMALDDFKKIVDKVPLRIAIVFSGFCEPFLNKDCVEMIEYAHKRGHQIWLYTTLVGLDRDKWDRIKEIPFAIFNVHLPDKNEYANIPVNEDYFELLDEIIKNKANEMIFSSQDEIEPSVLEHIPDGSKWAKKLHDRAGNLTGDEVTHKERVKGKIYCGKEGRKLENSVVLPNGDVVLCCMDFGLTRVLGNLLESSYLEIYSGKSIEEYRALMDCEDSDIICRKCEYAKSIPSKKKVMIAMPVAKYIETDCFLSIFNMDKPDNIEITMSCFDGYSVDINRNYLVKEAREQMADYIFWVDSDIVLPRDALTKLLEDDLDIVGGVYATKHLTEKRTTVLLRSIENDGYYKCSYEEIADYDLIKIDAIGFGCVLTKIEVFDKVEMPFFVYTSFYGEDIDFCRKAINAGYSIHADTRVLCGHLGQVNYNIRGK